MVAVPCGDHILRQGSRLNEVFIVRTGRLRVVMVSRSGWEVACSECRPGDCFGRSDRRLVGALLPLWSPWRTPWCGG
ncbi:cyclic nucleotide-binding domain-containing protein [Ancylobacter polymorphus]|uniref:cyclic nucleotide-binding domain-containing protein n=1 Tax=Ancylobacter polymorphus TaxID=223390 RepID=UPI003D76A389